MASQHGHLPPSGRSSLIALTVFFIALMTVGLLALQKQRAFDDVLLEDAVWATFQLDRELKNLRIALLEATPETIAHVKLNYDILYSRISVLEKGQVADLVARIDLRNQDLDTLLKRIKELDPAIRALSPDQLPVQRKIISQALRTIQEKTKDLVVQTNLHFAEKRQRIREGITAMIRGILAFAAMALFSGFIIVRQLRRQRRFIDVRREELVTSNRELEKARHEAEQASKAKTDFMAVLSHEVRTPLNGIFGLTEIIQKEMKTDSQVHQYLRTLRSSADAVFTVVNDVLDYSRIQAGKLSLNRRSFSLDDFLVTLSQSYQLQTSNGPVAFRYEYPRYLGYVFGDPDRLRQILMNLLNNAFKFTDTGYVSLNLDARRSEEVFHLCFTVRDTGCGISKDDQHKLFQPFSQVDNTLTRSHQGSGLGLVICKELVERMEGHIRIDSEHGQGSRFDVELVLPIAVSTEDAGASARTVADFDNVTSNADLLVVEDNPINQLVAREQLTLAGHRVTVVENGQAAIEALYDESFELVLMDMQMPVMDGLEATRQLRARGETRPIIAMTANAMDEDGKRCIDAGMQAVIKKPVSRDELLQTVQSYLVR